MTNKLIKNHLSDEISRRIREYIIARSLKPGDRLPTEQQMAEEFGVSRISIREATQPLRYFGLLDSSPRRGIILRELNMDRITEILGFQMALHSYSKELLLKTRYVIESGALRYTMNAIKSNPAVFNKLTTLCNNMGQAKDAQMLHHADAAFHRTLVETSGVEPLLAFNELLDVFFSQFKSTLENQYEQAGVGGAAMAHRKIIDTLYAGNLAEAEELLYQHLSAFQNTV
ncbi:MAG: GntR family transcriptional regulator [Sedimentisphaerales bacterium]|nr:GntR family transcriptional regulator [Sedimentisphaerales bacterium]